MSSQQPRLRIDTAERRRLERVSSDLRGPFLARMGSEMTMAEAAAALGWLPAALSRWLGGGNIIAGGEEAVRAFIAAREVTVQRRGAHAISNYASSFPEKNDSMAPAPPASPTVLVLPETLN